MAQSQTMQTKFTALSEVWNTLEFTFDSHREDALILLKTRANE